MSSISFLSIDDYPLMETTNSYEAYVKDHLFYEKELISESRPNSELNKLAWGMDNVERPGKFDFLGFKQSARICKQRLELLGHSAKRSKRAFEEAKRLEKREGLSGLSFSGLTYRGYLKMVEEALKSKKIDYGFYQNNIFDFLCTNGLMLPLQNRLEGIYSILSVVDENAKVVYDLSDIYQAGYITKDEVSKFTGEKVVILAEGKTDVEFLSASLSMLYPHLVSSYHFLDFDGFKVEGGGSALVRLVKGLAAANVKHPVIALFDNDTAGILEMRKLQGQKLPDNIKVMKYPDIKIANRYPTIGPQGKKVVNINGKGCGIEMYLGRDLLSLDGGLSPVRWLDFNSLLGTYHGAVEQKDIIQKEFRSRFKAGATWEMPEMKQLLEMIFKAFQN